VSCNNIIQNIQQGIGSVEQLSSYKELNVTHISYMPPVAFVCLARKVSQKSCWGQVATSNEEKQNPFIYYTFNQ
jgi:hypothetical protein